MPLAAGARRVSSLADLHQLPKTELHLHLRGAIPHGYLRERFRKYPPRSALESAPDAQLAWMQRHPGIRGILAARDPVPRIGNLFRYDSFEQFLAAYLFTSYFVRDATDFSDLVAAVRRGLAAQNITYAEVTVSIPEYLQQGIEADAVLAVLANDPEEAPRVRWIVDLVRNLGPEAAEALLRQLVPRLPPTVAGITLGGAEHRFPPELFEQVYAVAREAGLRTTVHAGEALGPQSVWRAVETLKVERVGHGVRAAEDPALVRYLAAKQIPLEICPTSNIRTGVYPSLQQHPVRELFEAGVPLSINTDDPTFFEVSLAEELAGLRDVGFSWDEIDGLARGARRFAFCDAPSA